MMIVIKGEPEGPITIEATGDPEAVGGPEGANAKVVFATDELAPSIAAIANRILAQSAGATSIPEALKLVKRLDKRLMGGAPPKPDWPTIIRALRARLGATQLAFGAIAGVSFSVVSRWETGRLEPGSTELFRIQSFFLDHGLDWPEDLGSLTPPAAAPAVRGRRKGRKDSNNAKH